MYQHKDLSRRCRSFAFWNVSKFVGRGIENWDVSSMTDASEMFYNALLFNAPIGSWDVRKTQKFEKTFANTPFNQPLSNWQLQSATDLNSMFERSDFNQDISRWDVSRVSNMNGLFANATDFQQDLCLWGTKVGGFSTTIDMFQGTACPETSTPNVLIEPSGPWCEFCGSYAPTPNPLTKPGENGDFNPTTVGPTATGEPSSVDRVSLSDASRVHAFLATGAVFLTGLFLAL